MGCKSANLVVTERLTIFEVSTKVRTKFQGLRIGLRPMFQPFSLTKLGVTLKVKFFKERLTRGV